MSDTNSDTPPAGDPVTVGDRQVTAVRFERRDGAHDLTFVRGEHVLDTATGVRDPDALREHVGMPNTSRILRGGERGELSGRTLSAYMPAKEQAKGSAWDAEVAEPTRDWIDTGVPGDGATAPVAEPARKTAKRSKAANEVAPDPVAPSVSPDEIEARRRAAVLEQIREQFQVQGERYRFKDQGKALAFKDDEAKLVSGSSDVRAARAMAAMADAKGWTSIKVSGHEDFRREVWTEAQARGLAVSGYEPTEQERQESAKRSEERMTNTVERARGRDASSERPAAREGVTADPASVRSAPRPPGGPRVHEGELLEHGSAPYKNDPKEKVSYFVKIAESDGERTVWGKDLERAIREGEHQPGDRIALTNVGRKPVTVNQLVRDKDGNVTGEREIQSHLNRWESSRTGRAAVLQSVSSTLIDERVPDPDLRAALKSAVAAELSSRERAGTVPAVPMYDRSARPRGEDRTLGTGRDASQEQTR